MSVCAMLCSFSRKSPVFSSLEDGVAYPQDCEKELKLGTVNFVEIRLLLRFPMHRMTEEQLDRSTITFLRSENRRSLPFFPLSSFPSLDSAQITRIDLRSISEHSYT